jgi:glycosyltransferase involved in cell wall biosynthesis
MANYEGWICREFDHVLAVTKEDSQTLAQLARKPCSITVVPIAAAPQEVEVIHRQPDARHIVSVGSMFYPPNVEGALWFANAVYPLIQSQLPGTKLYLIGGRPAKEIRRLGDRDPDIVVTGYVRDLRPYLEQSAVMIAPLHFGSGMRVKVLDALTWGMPLVSTSFGCQGVRVTHTENVLIADRPIDFAAMVREVIQDRGLADTLAANGRHLIETEYDWRVVYRALDEAYADLIDTPRVAQKAAQ